MENGQEKKRDVVISLRNVSKTYKIREKTIDSVRTKVTNFFSGNHTRLIHALSDINLDIYKGEIFGIVGNNGSGKSTLLKVISGAYPPDKGGEVKTKGKMIRLALAMGFDPLLTGRENIYVNASVLGLSFKKIGRKFHEIVKFADLEDFVDTKVMFYSSGMKSRLAFAVALHAESDIFLMDEFFGGVGDARFKQKSTEIFKKSFLEGRTFVLVNHNLKIIEEFCQRAVLLEKGKVIALGNAREVIKKYEEEIALQKKK